jgi:hypothetical protein
MPIQAGAVAAGLSELAGPGWSSGAVGGGQASFQIQARDELGNPVVLEPGFMFEIDFSPNLAPDDYQIIDLEGGLFQVSVKRSAEQAPYRD